MSINDKKQFKRIEIPFFEGINSTVSDHIAKRQELSHGENIRSDKIGRLSKRGGYERLGQILSSTSNFGLHYFKIIPYLYRVSTVAAVTSIYYLDTSTLTWTALSGGGTNLTAANVSWTEAEGCLFVVNGTDANRYISTDGTTVVTATTQTGHLYDSPPAYKINYYKRRLYIGDYTLSSGTRQKNGIMMSSEPLGIVSLVDGDHTAPVTALKVFDTKYIKAGDVLEIYHGAAKRTFTIGDSTTQFDITNTIGNTYRYTWDSTGTDPLISTYLVVSGNGATEVTIAAQNFTAANNGTFTVTSVGANYFEVTNASGVIESNKTIGTGSITVNNVVVTVISTTVANTLTIKSFNVALTSADEVWIKGTKLGAKQFRWAGDGATGENVKEYDTFWLDGSSFQQITMMENVGDVQMFASKDNIAIWNGSSLRNLDMGVGCASDQGYVKKWGTLFFIHYGGIYATTGGTPKLISSKIQRYFDGATRAGIEASAASWNAFSIYFSIGDVTLYNDDGSTDKTLTDVMLEYNVRHENWYVHIKLNVDFMTAYVTASSSQEYIAFSSPDTDKVYIFPYETDDDDTDIHMQATTTDISLMPRFERLGYPKEIIVDSPQGHNIHVFVSLDKKPFYEVGVTEKGCTIIKVEARTQQESPARCRSMKISLRESSMSSCKINRVALIYSESEEEEETHE